MPFASKRAKLVLGDDEVRMLEQLVQSRSESAGRVERAKILLRYYRGATVSSIAAELRTNRPRVERIQGSGDWRSHGPARSPGQRTRAYLITVPNRFDFVFTPTHGSWLNLIESFFGKMAKTLLRGIRVSSKAELRARIEMYLREVNEDPVVFRWKYKLETLSVV